MDFYLYIIAGASVGFAVGLTGVGGGSLMTPILLMFGFPPHIAVGTDLLYAAVTKSGGVIAHHRQGTIRWRVALLLGAGSIPASLLTVYVLHGYFQNNSESYGHLLTSSLGFMLILTALVIIFKGRLKDPNASPGPAQTWMQQRAAPLTVVMGALLGVMVTLSSVGAGAIGTAVLLILYTRLPPIQIIGTDLLHAVPLTLVAGLGHLFLGNVDFYLLGSLLVGSLPAIFAGTWVGTRIPAKFLQPLLASVLLLIGCKYAFF